MSNKKALRSSARFIGADWGTSHLRLFLCDGEGVALEQRNGPGAAEAGGRFAAVFAAETRAWEAQQGQLPAVLCGMVGSRLGWIEAPYVPCPMQPEQIAGACIAIEDAPRIAGAGIHIVPGLSCRNRFGAPDVMRGEETQLLGALGLVESLRSGRQLVCLPGTHTKWVVLEEGRISDFFTAPTGELFAVLRDHSVLTRQPQGSEAGIETDAFEKGLASVAAQPATQVMHRLFECRSRVLSGELPAAAAQAYLSGLLIASDVHGALRALADTFVPRTVVLVGVPQLTQLYATACATIDLDALQLDGIPAALAGLTQVYRRLSEGGL